MGDTSEALRQTLARFVNTETPSGRPVTKWLKDELKKTDCNLGDRDAMLAMLVMAITMLEEPRGPVSRKIVTNLPKGG